jgi:hypothetical protein
MDYAVYLEEITAWIGLRSAVGGRIHELAPAMAGGQPVKLGLAGERVAFRAEPAELAELLGAHDPVVDLERAAG